MPCSHHWLLLITHTCTALIMMGKPEIFAQNQHHLVLVWGVSPLQLQGSPAYRSTHCKFRWEDTAALRHRLKLLCFKVNILLGWYGTWTISVVQRHLRICQLHSAHRFNSNPCIQLNLACWFLVCQFSTTQKIKIKTDLLSQKKKKGFKKLSWNKKYTKLLQSRLGKGDYCFVNSVLTVFLDIAIFLSLIFRQKSSLVRLQNQFNWDLINNAYSSC